MNPRTTTLGAVAATIGLLSGSATTARNLIANGNFGTGNLDGWTTTSNAPNTITDEGTAGNPSGSALPGRDNTAAAGNYIDQIVPVSNGAPALIGLQRILRNIE